MEPNEIENSLREHLATLNADVETQIEALRNVANELESLVIGAKDAEGEAVDPDLE